MARLRQVAGLPPRVRQADEGVQPPVPVQEEFWRFCRIADTLEASPRLVEAALIERLEARRQLPDGLRLARRVHAAAYELVTHPLCSGEVQGQRTQPGFAVE